MYLYHVLRTITSLCSFLELDVLYITVQNEFQWIGGDKNEMSAVHLDILTVTVSSLCQHVVFLIGKPAKSYLFIIRINGD
jgi:hypothetical protein